MCSVLWLPSWYPSKDSPQNGDFIKRHAFSVIDKVQVYLLYISNSYQGNECNKIDFEEHKYCFLTENLILNKRKNKGFISRTIAFFQYFILNHKYLKRYIKSNSLPNLIHVHVSFRAGIIALFFKYYFGIPYVITEHWSLFNKERSAEFRHMGFLLKFVLRIIFKRASYVLPVSRDLESNLKLHFPFINTKVIPNVVDTNNFYFEGVNNSCNFRFIHVSSGSLNKNVNKIINAFLLLKKEEIEASLTLIGHEIQDISVFDIDFLSQKNIYILGKCSHDVVAEQMRRMNAFILFSDYETQSCVSIEALCCGLPVISSRLPCIEEFITEENGILVPPGDQIALYHAMESMVKNYSRYNRLRISKDAQLKYNSEEVGKQIIEIYDEVLAKK